jgi:hypothetical protein
MQVRLKKSLIEAGRFYRAGTVMAAEELPEFARDKERYYEEVPKEQPPIPIARARTGGMIATKTLEPSRVAP